MRYYGNASCGSCRTTKMMLDKYGMPVEFIDVASIKGFTGDIPQLELDTGELLIGAPAIQRWIMQIVGRAGERI